MQFVAPDILEAGKGLSVTASGIGLGLGLLVWLLGGWGHRFWLVLVTTLAAGIHGVTIGEAFDVQPLVAGLLLAVAAGALALSLVRVGAFLAGGVTACVLGTRLLPFWQEPFVFFFVGGFLGLFLLRLWLMVLSSLAGTLMMVYSLLWLLDALGKLDALEWSARKPVLLNWACGGVTLLGLLVQIGVVRRFRPREEDEDRDEDRGGRRPRILGWFSSSSKRGRRAA
jgi:hypothetical protein